MKTNINNPNLNPFRKLKFNSIKSINNGKNINIKDDYLDLKANDLVLEEKSYSCVCLENAKLIENDNNDSTCKQYIKAEEKVKNDKLSVNSIYNNAETRFNSNATLSNYAKKSSFNYTANLFNKSIKSFESNSSEKNSQFGKIFNYNFNSLANSLEIKKNTLDSGPIIDKSKINKKYAQDCTHESLLKRKNFNDCMKLDPDLNIRCINQQNTNINSNNNIMTKKKISKSSLIPFKTLKLGINEINKENFALFDSEDENENNCKYKINNTNNKLCTFDIVHRPRISSSILSKLENYVIKKFSEESK